MRYVRLRDILWQKSTSRARELVGNYSYRTSSKSVGNRSHRLARKYFYGESVGKSCKTTLSPSYTKWFFSSIEVHVVAWPVQQEDFRWEFQEGDIGGVLSASTTSANTEISQKIAKYRNASIGRVETGCHTTITTLYVKFTANNTETTIRNL